MICILCALQLYSQQSKTGNSPGPGEGKGYPLQHSGLENSMDCIVHGGHKELDTTERLSLSLSFISRRMNKENAMYSSIGKELNNKKEQITNKYNMYKSQKQHDE